jgi:hypothetical protein
MTQPDELFPSTTANYDSLAAHAAKTQTDWEDENTGLETDRWGTVRDGLRGGLDLSYPLPVAILRYIAQSLGLGGALDTLEHVGAAIGGFITDINDGLSGLLADLIGTPETVIGNITNVIIDGTASVQNFLDDLFNGHTGGSATGKTAAQVKVAVAGTVSTANTASTNATTAIASVSSLTAVLEGGYTQDVYDTPGSYTWNTPAGSIIECWVLLWSSGSGGAGGNGGAGGSAATQGLYCAQQINPADLGAAGTGHTVVVPAGGAGAAANTGGTPPNNGTDSTFGSLASSANGVLGGVIGSFVGWQDATGSEPAAGGAGGIGGGSAANGTAGGSTPSASGGAGGTVGAGHNGSDGADADPTDQTPAGGGGGGGGAGGNLTPGATAFGGIGGKGGNPGGAGGAGGGQGVAASPGDGGDGGDARVIVRYKLV